MSHVCARPVLVLSIITLGSILSDAPRALGTTSETAAQVRGAAVEALDQIESGHDPSRTLSPRAWTFLQALAVARAELGLGVEEARHRRDNFIADESAALPDSLMFREASTEAIEAVLWALTEKAPSQGEATRGAKDRLAPALEERLRRAPELGPEWVEQLPAKDRASLDLDLLRRLRGACQTGLDDRDRPLYDRIVVLIAASSVADAISPDLIAAEAVPTLLDGADPRATWGQVVAVLSPAMSGSDRSRLANGRMLLAYLGLKEPASTSVSSLACEHWLSEYLNQCHEVHPVRDDVPRPLDDPGRIQADVFGALFAVVTDKRPDFGNAARKGGRDWRSEVARIALAQDLMTLGESANAARFAGAVRNLDSAVAAHSELTPALLELLAWRPEFWDPQTWSEGSAFAEWPGPVRTTLARDVLVHRRLLDRFWGSDRLAPPPRTGAAGEQLLEWVKSQTSSEPQGPLIDLYRAVARTLTEDDLYLVQKLGGDDLKGDDKDLVKRANDAHASADQNYIEALEQLGQLLRTGTPSDEGLALLGAVEARYARLRATGPGAQWPTYDGKNYHDPQLDDRQFARHLAIFLRAGAQADIDQGPNETVGGWRARSATTLLWLAAARAHERLGERNYLRAGFLFRPETDFKRKQALEPVRTARRHFLAARALYQSLCRPLEGVKEPYGDSVTETPSSLLPDLQPTPLQAIHGESGSEPPLLAAVIQAGLRRTKVQLARLESGLDATGCNGAIGMIRRFEDLSTRLESLAKLIEQGFQADYQQFESSLDVEAARLGATAADLRVAAQAERAAAAELEVGQARLGVERAKWVRNAFSTEELAQHFATEAARQSALGAKAEAEKALVLLNQERFRNFVVDAQIEMIFACLPQYVVELHHSRAIGAQTKDYLDELAKKVDERHKQWLDNRPKDILGFVAKLTTFLVDSICTFYGMPPLGSIVNTSAQGIVDLAEGRVGAGLSKLARAAELGGGKEALEKGLDALGNEINSLGWVKDIKSELAGDKPGGQGAAAALIRGFGQSVLPDDFTALLQMDPKAMSGLMMEAAKDPEGTYKDLREAYGKVGDRLGDGENWERFLQGQALAVRQRIYRGAVGLGTRAAVDLLGDTPEQREKLKDFLNRRLNLDVKGKDEVVRQMTEGIVDDGIKKLHTRLTEIYAPFSDLKKSIAARAEKASENHRGFLVDYLKRKGYDDKQIDDLVAGWRSRGTDPLKDVKEAARADVEGLLRALDQRLTSEEFWKGIEKGQPEGIRDLGWLPSLAETLIDGSLSREMMLVYSDKSQQEGALRDYGATLKAALVAIQVSVDGPVAAQVSRKFELVQEGAEVKVSREWEAELEALLSRYYGEEDARAKADIERFWRNIQDTFESTELSKDTLEILSNPPEVTLPAEIRAQLQRFDQAAAEVNAACNWLVNAQHYKEQIDQVVEIQKEDEYRRAREQMFGTLDGKLDEALSKLQAALDEAGSPKDPGDFRQQMAGVSQVWAENDVKYARLLSELADKENEKKQLVEIRNPVLAQYVQEQTARLSQEIAGFNKELEPLRPGRDPAGADDDHRKLPDRLVAQARMREIFGFITPEPRQADETTEAYRKRQFQATKDQVAAMLQKIEQGADGLFATVNELDRDAYMIKFDLAAGQLEQVAKTHSALAFGLQAAQSRAMFNSAGFRTKQAEVEFAIAQGYVQVADRRANEERIKLQAAQVDYQQARTQLDLARLDRELFDRLFEDRALYDTPAQRQSRQTAVWRAARDAAFFVRVYNGIGTDQVELPTPGVCWSPAAIRLFADRLKEARHLVEYDRKAFLDVPDVTAVISIDKRLVDERGQKFQDRDGTWQRFRVSVRGLRADGVDVSPYPPRLSWFITEDEVNDGNWRVLREEVKRALSKLALMTRRSPLEDWRRVETPAEVDSFSKEDLLASLNDALTRVQTESFYAAELPALSRTALQELTDLPVRPVREALDTMVGDGRLVLVNRLCLESHLPSSLARSAGLRFPHYIDARGIGRERTALFGVAVFIKKGSAKGRQDSDIPIRVRHLGDGWITASDPVLKELQAIPIPWESPGYDTRYPLPQTPEELDLILSAPDSEVAARITKGTLNRTRVESSFSTYYPFLGTYEIMILDGLLRDDFQYKIVLLGSAVEKAREAAAGQPK